MKGTDVNNCMQSQRQDKAGAVILDSSEAMGLGFFSDLSLT
jgi:hypothetical protein